MKESRKIRTTHQSSMTFKTKWKIHHANSTHTKPRKVLLEETHKDKGRRKDMVSLGAAHTPMFWDTTQESSKANVRA